MNVGNLALFFPSQWTAVGGEKPQATIEAKFRQYDRDNKPTVGTVKVKAFGGMADAVLALPPSTSAIVKGQMKRIARQTPEGKRTHTEIWIEELSVIEGKLNPLKAITQPKSAPAPQPAKAAAQSMAAAFGGETLDYEEIPF